MTTLKRKLLKKLRSVSCRLQPSQKHGVGVFAIQDIPKHANPFPDAPKTRWLRFSKATVAKLPQETATMIRQFYGTSENTHLIPYCGLNNHDISFYMNHSSRPNVAATHDSERFITLRRIQKGEELFLDYRVYDPDDEAVLKRSSKRLPPTPQKK